MVNKELIKYSLENLKHRRTRSFLTIFSIMIGIATIFIFISFGYGLYEYTNDFTQGSSADKVLILAKGSGLPGTNDAFKLTNDDLEVVENSAGVYEASGVYYDTVEVKKNSQNKFVFAVSYDPKTPLIMDVFGVGVEKGRQLRSGDNKKVVLGYNYLVPGKIFEKVLEVNDNLEVDGEDVKIVGFLESVGNPQDDSQIYVTNDYFEELIPDKDTYAQIVARVDISQMGKVISNIENDLRKHRDLGKGKEDFFVQSFEDFLESFSSALNIIVGFIILIALISIIVSAVNTANTMVTSVLERYKEIGILKAIGAKNSEIFGIFLFESSALGLAAGILGVLLGFIITFIGASILDSFGWGFLQPSYSPILIIGCILFATITGAISGVAPAIKASKINPVEALRNE